MPKRINPVIIPIITMGDSNEDSAPPASTAVRAAATTAPTLERGRCAVPTINSAVRSVGCHLRHKTTTIRRLGHSKQQRVVESSASATATNGCRGRDKYHCETLRMTAVAANDGRGSKRRPWQQRSAVATNDAVGISRSRSNIKSFL
jgi:hypothetical protein